MVRRFVVPIVVAAALVPAAGWAQSAAQSAAATDGAATQDIAQKIHDMLTARGFKDVKVVPSSFMASGKDKDGKPVVLMISPHSMTTLTPADPAGTSDGGKSDDRKIPLWQ